MFFSPAMRVMENPQLETILEVTKLTKLFGLYDTIEDALQPG